MQVALVTGASRGLGLSLARALAARGWALVVDARGADELGRAVEKLARLTTVRAVVGDVADAGHRSELLHAVTQLGGLDVLVNNASVLGPSPRPDLASYPIAAFEAVLSVNVVAPLALTQLVLAQLEARHGRIINVTSDAAVEAYAGWGGYGASKAAFEQWSRVLAAEHPDILVYQLDPGDLRTRLHQDAFPGEDISDRPLPEVAVPGILRLLDQDLASGRYRALELAPDRP